MISVTINGKEVFSTKDIIFFVISGFMIGFVITSGIYTESILLSILVASPVLLMLIIYILKIVKTLQENVISAKDHAISKKSKEDRLPPQIEVTKPSKKFFEA